MRTDRATAAMTGLPHPIEVESYRILAERVDLSAWPADQRALVARIVHATADESLADKARIGPEMVPAGIAALRSGAVVICDARMVVAGAPGIANTTCLLDEVPVAPPGDTRSAAAIRLAARRWPDGALWVVGNAPTALAALLDEHRSGRLEPAAVIGVPVGYVGAAEAKAALWAGPLAGRSLTVLGRRGGTPVAAAVLNALGRLAGELAPDSA